uniref:hypothetical protein n=1 Tax=Inonotus hispidus TaxID=40469 RepID=UPI0021823D2A|nr:hypothetical protein N4M07_mgp041 [Inonotus hispidus]UVF38011.1 hypothetical protein [Inonotus hispidus]
MNSLTGRFGMKPRVAIHEVINTSDLSSIISKVELENLIDTVELGDKTLNSYWPIFSRLPKINVAIAATKTANARVFMSKFKTLSGYILYYTDTGSTYFNKPLPDNLIDSKKIGFFKALSVLDTFVALGPKVYRGRTVDGVEFTKTKGLKTKVTLNQLAEFLNEMKISQLTLNKRNGLTTWRTETSPLKKQIIT